MKVLNSVWTVEDNELRDTIATILKRVRNGKFALDLMPAAFARIKTYIEGGFVKGPSIDDLKATFQKGIKKAKPRTVYSNKFESTYSFMTSKIDADTKEIANEVLDFYKELGKEEFIRSFHDSLEKLWSEPLVMDEFVSSHYDLLNSLNANELFKRFKSAKNVERQRFAAFLQSRVEYACTAVPEENSFLKQFKLLSDDYLKNNDKPSTLRRYLLYINNFLGKYGVN